MWARVASSAAWAMPTANAPTLGPEEVQGVHGDPESPAGLAEHVVARSTGTASKARAPMGCGESMSRAVPVSPGPVGGDEERGDAAGSGALGRTGEDGVEVGLGGVGDPALLAGEPPAVPAPVAGRAARASAAASEPAPGSLSAKAATAPPGAHPGQPARALGGGAGPDDRVGAEALEGEGGLGLRAAVGEGFAQQAQIERARRSNSRSSSPSSPSAATSGRLTRPGSPFSASGRSRSAAEGAQLGAPGGLCRIERECGHPAPSPAHVLSRTVDCRHHTIRSMGDHTAGKPTPRQSGAHA